jgi:hypothetical protein
MKDATVLAPPAINGQVDLEGLERAAREEKMGELEQMLRDARQTIETQQITLRTFSNVLACLVKICTDMAGRADTKLIIDRATSDRMEGAKVTVGETVDRDVIVQIRERAPDHLWEGRHG